MYAQTLCYGLFAARCAAPGQAFTRQAAANMLPWTNPFLRKLFNTIAGPDLDERIAWAVDQSVTRPSPKTCWRGSTPSTRR